MKTFIHAASSYQILKLSSEDSKLEKKNRKKDRGFHIIEDYSATLSEARNEQAIRAGFSLCAYSHRCYSYQMYSIQA